MNRGCCLFLFLFFVRTSLCADYFVTPNRRGCFLSCKGTLQDPFDNLLSAISATNSVSEVNLILLYDSISPHYVLMKEPKTTNFSSYEITEGIIISVNNLTIRPLYCYEDLVLANSSLSNQCVQKTQKLPVYLKSTSYTIRFRMSARIEGLIFDAVEDIKSINLNSSDLQDCLTSRKRCCQGSFGMSLVYPLTVRCGSGNINLDSQPFFSFNSTKSNISELVFQDTDFVNFMSSYLSSLVHISHLPFNLTLNGSNIENTYFYYGIIFLQDSVLKNGSSIVVNNVNFTKHNYFKEVTLQKSSGGEGYLFYAPNTFLGSIRVSNSSFQKMNTALRDECWSVEGSGNYQLPLNNRAPISLEDTTRWSNLLILYNADHVGIKGSSLINLEGIDGSVEIVSCTFENIIGTSGSVLRIDDVISPNNTFRIYNSTFKNNFAYNGFANIRIAKKSNPYFNAFFECPQVEMVNSIIINSTGCPGTYGNVLFLCYWFPDVESKSYTDDLVDPEKILKFREDIAKTKDENYPALVTVRNCTFQNNLLALSNSLAIVGAYTVALEGNQFQDNGGTTGKIGIYVFNEITLKKFKVYPKIQSLTMNDGTEINFGQSTAVYIADVINLYSKNNIYERNWGPWEGSMALAASLTIKDWVQCGTIKFKGDSFRGHGRIPSLFTPWLEVDGWSYYTEPILSINYAYILDTSIFGDSINIPAQIIMQNVAFVDNIASYDLADFKYNKKYLGTLVDYLQTGWRHRLGLFKLNSVKESIEEAPIIDKLNLPLGFKTKFIFSEGEISNNTVLSSGCLFTTSWAELYIVESSKITQNRVNDLGPWPGNSPDTKRLAFTNIDQMTDALFCLRIEDTVTDTIGRMVWKNLLMKDNKGALMGASQFLGSRFYLTDSIFINNTCTQTGMFIILDLSSFASLNNLFIGNNNTLGITFLNNPTLFSGINNMYLKNDGMYSSILFLQNAFVPFNFQESFAKIYWNTVNPTYKFFSNDIVPQAGLYFITTGSMIFSNCDIWQNTPYSGLVISIGSQINFEKCMINDHHIIGVSILGVYVESSVLNIFETQMGNFSISGTYQEKFISSAVMVLFASKMFVRNLEITNGLISQKASLIFGNDLTASIQDIKIANCYQTYISQPALLVFIFSDISIENLDSFNTTGLFSSSWSKVKIEEGLIRELKALNNMQYLLSGDNTNLNFKDVVYIGNGESGELTPFVKGENMNVELIKINFLNAMTGYNILFDLKDGGSLIVLDSIFEYSSELTNTTIFDLASVYNVAIYQCLFNLVGTVLKATDLYADFYFISNTMLRNPHIKSILLKNAQSCYLADNAFMGENILAIKQNSFESDATIVLSEPQIQFIDNSGEIILKGNVLISLLGLNGVIKIDAKNFPYNLVSNQNIFISNIASQGGAIFLEATKLSNNENLPSAKIINSIFALNRAITYQQTQGIGGALYLATLDLAVQQTEIIDSIFLRNSAEFNGGAIFFDHSQVNISNTSIFRDNKALKLNHIGSKPSYFVYIDGSIDLNFTYVVPSEEIPSNIKTMKTFYLWDNLVSGLETQRKFMFALIDMFGQLVNDQSSILTFKAQDSNKGGFSLNEISLQAQSGFYSLQNPKFQYLVSNKLNVTVTSTATNNLNQQISPLTIEMTFRGCGVGEFKLEQGNNVVCQKCPSGFWQLEPNTSAVSCSDCETDKVICLGGNKVGPKPGYWRMNETAELVLQCPRTSSCIGNLITTQEIIQNDSEDISLSPTGKCEEGYQGNLCYDCSPGYAKSSSSQDAECLPCKMDWGSYCLLGLLICFKVALIVLSVKGTMQLAESYSQNNQDYVANDAVLLRILLNYLQLVSLVIGIPVTWPNFLREVFNATTQVSSVSEQAFSVECFILSASQSLGLKPVFFKVIFAGCIPFIFVVFAIIFWIIYFKIKKRPILFGRDFKNKVITTIIIICYQNQAAAIQSAINIFRCANLYRKNQPVYFLQLDYDMECWDQEHFYWLLTLGLPVLFVWVILFPGILILILIKNKKKLHMNKIAKKYSFIYGGYRLEKYYWEFVIFFRKMLIMIVTILAGLHSVGLQLHMTILLIIFSCFLHQINRPYSDITLNNLERASLMSSGVVNFAALYFYIKVQGQALYIIIMIFGLLGDLYFLVLFLKLFLKAKASKLMQNEKVANVLRKVAVKFTCITRILFINHHIGSQLKQHSLTPNQELKQLAKKPGYAKGEKINVQFTKKKISIDEGIIDSPLSLGSPHYLKSEEEPLEQEEGIRVRLSLPAGISSTSRENKSFHENKTKQRDITPRQEREREVSEIWNDNEQEGKQEISEILGDNQQEERGQDVSEILKDKEQEEGEQDVSQILKEN